MRRQASLVSPRSLADERAAVSGSLAWSLRPHAVNGGFKTHGEGNNIFSYHAPGWPAESPEFDRRERDVVSAIRQAGFALTGDRPPSKWPVPSSPQIIFHPDAGAGKEGAFFWRGGSWAHTYEVWVNVREPAHQLGSCSSRHEQDQGGGEEGWECSTTGLTECVRSTSFKVIELTPGRGSNVQPGQLRCHCSELLGRKGCERMHVMVRGVSMDGEPGPFSCVCGACGT